MILLAIDDITTRCRQGGNCGPLSESALRLSERAKNGIEVSACPGWPLAAY